MQHKTRYIFFTKAKDEERDKYQLLAHRLKEDKKQLRIISKVLHMAEYRVAQTIVGHAMIDLFQIDIELNESTDSDITELEDSEEIESP